jgi:malate synthase
MSSARVDRHGLQVDAGLAALVEDDVLPGTGIAADTFWAGFAAMVADLQPRNRELLDRRDELQAALDAWYATNDPTDVAGHRALLEELGYLVAPPSDLGVTTSDVDREIAEVAGPQLVVPVDNARYALNAANARWGSLYDALYGTDAMGDAPPAGPYDTARGDRVVAWARGFLDGAVPLATGSWTDVHRLDVADGALRAALADDTTVGLADPDAFVGHGGDPAAPVSVVLVHHGLHVEVVVDRDHPVGATDPAGIADVVLESAVTTIADVEDSVAAVDAADKVGVYRNWLGLMRGDLTTEVSKGGQTFTRRLAEDRVVTGPNGDEVVLPGRSLLLVRHVGIHMTTDAVLDAGGAEVFEGLLDAVVLTAAALHDVGEGGRRANSRAGRVHVVKPKLHGPEEVAFAVEVLARTETLLGLAPGTVTVGIMDEERRTTLNLAACIAEGADRVVFVNTGFLDRTGDEIHSVMAAGPVVRKGAMKQQGWIDAYERWNVDVALAAGMRGRAQIGKGMWAAPARMAAMLAEKVGHPRAGATTAWVPSPTAATLHATHYHDIDVAAVQDELATRPPATLEELLVAPVVADPTWSDDELRDELRNNLQGILGYVVRWVDQGVGCSTVPDIADVGLMEDRATLRISSQHVANWLLHGIVTEQQVEDVLREMAGVVDEQNADDLAYRPMAPDPAGSVAFLAARDLVLQGRSQPNGYTETILTARRREAKAAVTGS